jgi:hypothetical protein
MSRSYVIDVAEEHATCDEICFEPCRIARLVSWSRRSASEIPAPLLMVGGFTQRVLNRADLYRSPPNAMGCAHTWRRRWWFVEVMVWIRRIMSAVSEEIGAKMASRN